MRRGIKVSILTPDISHNCLGRAYLLAKMLQERYEVEIVGPMLGQGLWEVLKDDTTITYDYVPFSKNPLKSLLQVAKLSSKVRGDIIYVSKPLLVNMLIGLSHKLRFRKPMIVDIDDWQMGFILEMLSKRRTLERLKYFLRSSAYLFDVASYWNTYLGERFLRMADAITVSNSYLQEKYGGEIIWHARDESLFNPDKYDRDALRRHYRIDPSRRIVLFLGSPRPYKGIEDLILALRELKDVSLLIVGMEDNSYCKRLTDMGRELLGDRFIPFGVQPFERAPEFLAISDLVVVPQRRTYATVGQFPAKIFDAMAMAKPIVSTDVGDIPKVLEGCGLIVPPNDPHKLSEAIRHLLENPELAGKLGRAAREKFLRLFSFGAVKEKLLGVFRSYEERVLTKGT